ncbi:MAG: hypothetical protein ACFNVM_00490, partial [Neisseria elongata]
VDGFGFEPVQMFVLDGHTESFFKLTVATLIRPSEKRKEPFLASKDESVICGCILCGEYGLGRCGVRV